MTVTDSTGIHLHGALKTTRRKKMIHLWNYSQFLHQICKYTQKKIKATYLANVVTIFGLIQK